MVGELRVIAQHEHIGLILHKLNSSVMKIALQALSAHKEDFFAREVAFQVCYGCISGGIDMDIFLLYPQGGEFGNILRLTTRRVVCQKGKFDLIFIKPIEKFERTWQKCIAQKKGAVHIKNKSRR